MGEGEGGDAAAPVPPLAVLPHPLSVVSGGVGRTGTAAAAPDGPAAWVLAEMPFEAAALPGLGGAIAAAVAAVESALASAAALPSAGPCGVGYRQARGVGGSPGAPDIPYVVVLALAGEGRLVWGGCARVRHSPPSPPHAEALCYGPVRSRLAAGGAEAAAAFAATLLAALAGAAPRRAAAGR